MLYDNGAKMPNIAPRPSFANNGNLPPSLFAGQPGNIGKFNRYMPPRRTAAGTPIAPVAGQPMPMPQYPQPNQQQPYQPNMHQFLAAYGKQGGGMFQVGTNQQQPATSGWGYMRQPMPQNQFSPAGPYGPPRYQQPGNPFMPAIPY